MNYWIADHTENLKKVLSIENSFDVMDGTFVNGNSREGFGLQQFDYLFDCGIDRDGDHLGPWLHGVTHDFSAEFNH